jgi:hypothetical protein
MKDGYIQQWNVSVERTLPFNSALTVAYVGNKGTRLPWYGYSPNYVAPGPGDIQSRRPYPQYGPINYVDAIGATTYNALQARWERRFAAGLQFLANYRKRSNEKCRRAGVWRKECRQTPSAAACFLARSPPAGRTQSLPGCDAYGPESL